MTPNKFPLHVFPQPMQEMIDKAQITLKYPVDFTASAALFAASAAIGNSFKLSVNTGWMEAPILFMAIVGKPNTNKSHPISQMLKPIFDNDRETYYKWEKENEIYEGAGENDRGRKPVWKKTLVTDFTPEALISMHQNNPRGMIVYIDELVGWFKNFNRYHKGSEQELWLSIWSMKPVQIDRKAAKPVYVPNPFIGVIGTIQNSILYEMGKENRGRNGFIDRILFSFPQNVEKPYPAMLKMDEFYFDVWKKILNKIINIQDNHILKMTDSDWEILLEWEKRNTDECRALENDPLAGNYGKFDVYIKRFIIILEILYWAYSGETEPPEYLRLASVTGACALCDYYKACARDVYTLMDEAKPMTELSTKQKLFYDTLPVEFQEVNIVAAAHSVDISRSTAYRWLHNTALYEHYADNLFKKRL